MISTCMRSRIKMTGLIIWYNILRDSCKHVSVYKRDPNISKKSIKKTKFSPNSHNYSSEKISCIRIFNHCSWISVYAFEVKV